MRGLVLAIAIAGGGCIKTAAVTCGDGNVCAPDHVCDEVHNTCVFPDQLETCKQLDDGTLCDINGEPGGICKDKVCIPATCGDELVSGDEVCDGATDIPEVGTCVDFAYDYGPLSCNALCAEGFQTCRRLGWQLRSLNGSGRIGGIWEDGADLWLANQMGIYRRHNGVWDPLVQPTGTTVWYHGIWASGGHAFAVGGALLGVWGQSPSDVYVVGGKAQLGSVWHFDGTAWSEMALPSATSLLRAVWGTGGEVFAVGNVPDNDVTTPDATIVHYDGTLWTEMEIPYTEELFGISGRSADEVFAVGGRPGSNILYFDGAAWASMVSNVEGTVLGLQAVHAGPSGVYAAKRPNLL
ncbi:MAG TPA: hypothetical protein VIV11_42630, partial [Kofleriaceae bacterium]